MVFLLQKLMVFNVIWAILLTQAEATAPIRDWKSADHISTPQGYHLITMLKNL